MAPLRFVWTDGYVKFGPLANKLRNHLDLLSDLCDEKGLAYPPENYVGGEISKDSFHEGIWHVHIEWAYGEHPNERELEYILPEYLNGSESHVTLLSRLEERKSLTVAPPREDTTDLTFPVDWLDTGNETENDKGWRAYMWGPNWHKAPHPEALQLEKFFSPAGLTWEEAAEWLKQHSTNPYFLEALEQAIPNQNFKWSLHIPEAERDPVFHWLSPIDFVIEKVTSEYVTSSTVEDSEPAHNFGFLKDPHKELYPCAWDGVRMKPEANHKIKSHVLNALEQNGFPDADKWIYFTVYGSGASYNWDEEGDFDVQMWVDNTVFNDLHSDTPMTQDDLVAEVRKEVQKVNFPTFADLNLETDDCAGDMLIQYYAKPGTGTKEENLAQKPYACYDMETDKWLKKPKPITSRFYGEAFLMCMPKAEDIALQAEGLIAELDRHVVNWQFWTAMYKKYSNPRYREEAQRAKDSAEDEREGIHNLFLGVFKGRQEAYGEGGKGIKDERDLLQKLLEVWGIFQDLRHYSKMKFPWEETEMPKAESSHRFAAWSDVMQKAIRYYNGGNVSITANNPDYVQGEVQGSDPSPYETWFSREDPNSQAITQWGCSCPWGQVSWGRTRQWKKYEGRPCAHTLALFWTALKTQAQAPPEEQTQLPVENQPIAPGAMNLIPTQPPIAVPPPSSYEQLEIPGVKEWITSNWKRLSVFENGDVVRTKRNLSGIDRDEQTRIVPKGTVGEVLWSDEVTTIAIFPLETSYLEPHLVKVQSQPVDFAPAQGDPFVKRRRP